MAQRIIEPPQKTPFNQERGDVPFDRQQEIFSKVWWLYFNRLTDAVNGLLEASEDTDDTNTAVTAAQSVANFNLTTSYADITGMSFTLTKTGIWLIIASVQFNVEEDDTVAARLVAAGSPQSRFIVLRTRATATETLMGTQAWVIRGRAGDTVKLQGEILTEVTGGDQTVEDGTTMTGIFLSSVDSTMADSNTALTAAQSVATFNLPGAYADIDGMTVTLDKAGVWMIQCSVESDVAQDDTVAMRLTIDGVDQTGFIVLRNRAAATETLMGTQTWIINGVIGNIIALQGEILVNNTGGDTTSEDGTTMTAVFLHS